MKSTTAFYATHEREAALAKERENKIIELTRLIRFGVTDFVGQHIVTE